MVNFYSCYVGPCNERTITVDDVAEHVNYIRNLIGVDHIGIGGDYNGVSEMPDGLENVSKYPNLFAVLLEQNWTEEDLGKIASGNIIRVWKKVEEVRDMLQSEIPSPNWIPKDDLLEENLACSSDNY